MTQSNRTALLRSYLRGTPLSAAKYGLFTHLALALEGKHEGLYRTRLDELTKPLREELDACDVVDISRAVADISGKPTRAVMAQLTSPEITGFLAEVADHWLDPELAEIALRWQTSDPDRLMLSLPTGEDAAARRELCGQLLRRVTEMRAALAGHGAIRVSEVPIIDGRTLHAAARAWQLPDITGVLLDRPEQGAARHPNRVGRCSAALVLSRLTAAIRGEAPDSEVVDQMLLVCAVAESVSPMDEVDESKAARGVLPIRVRTGTPLPHFLSPMHAWGVLSNWGSTSSRMAGSVPLAWKLDPIEADVVLWALNSAATRVAVAAGHRQAREVQDRGASSTWAQFQADSLPTWERGAVSAWSLMQTGRRPKFRTEWPGHILADPDDESTWPWGESPADSWDAFGTMDAVPALGE